MPMTLSEKLLCHNAANLSKPHVSVGETIIVHVARTLASEVTLFGIKKCMEAIGNPSLWKNDRFFLACDHSVDPRNYDDDEIQKRIKLCEEFSTKNALKDYFGPNESILHTEFYRQRAVPGTIIIGADSHSCAHGCVGALAIGLGAADVTMPLVTGTTWLTVPETVLVTFQGSLPFGFVGKDVMLCMLAKWKRNTVVFDRCVEYSGAIDQLSIDDRFSIANMATEWGAMAGVFPGDELTAGFVEGRPKPEGPAGSSPSCTNGVTTSYHEQEIPAYFRADEGAAYVAKLELDLTEVQYTVARWPSPDHVFAVSDPTLDEPVYDGDRQVCKGIRFLDGCFIGACTTTEKEIILAGLLLEVMMKDFGFVPKARPERPYKRQVTPGSKIMLERLERIGVLEIYRRAGFIVGAPGCSYCLGMGVDKALEGEIWLSSQNRNFKHRMGKGAIGSITSATVVAASSFQMTITDPTTYIKAIDQQRFYQLFPIARKPIIIAEPRPSIASPSLTQWPATAGLLPKLIEGHVQLFGDAVDTDAIIPAEFIISPQGQQGEKAFAFARPEFVGRVKEGATIVVAGEGFGCGSSREEAASCLRFAGVQAVIAKSFAFIFGRNLLTMNLFGICMNDPAFYAIVKEGTSLKIDVPNRTIFVDSHKFSFSLSKIQETIYDHGGLISMYRSQGCQLYSHLAQVGNAESLCCSSLKW